ncbi:BglG family transcription antiterminator [Carnobacterium maltaromaticum]|uniref:BglG family transcription antiterminator n=1 Tax=Carnobacterium maltaromaticum TaxID=2751 RepID=UPI00295E63DA|nr:BglG family transcription antiterminator [Carnobacterium maltaromaticum]
MVLERREKEIVTILLASELTTISKIAETMHLSSKTISQSLKIIDNYFAGSGLSLIRKPKVGISLVGDRDQLNQLMQFTNQQAIPTTKEERVQYLCFKIIEQTSYFTRQELQDSLFIGKTTLEKDMNKVNEIFALFDVTIEWIPGKGSFLNLMEHEKRKLAVDLIYYFWSQNWQVVKTEESFTHTIEGVPDFAKGFVNLQMLKEIDELLQDYFSKSQPEMSDMSYHSLLLHLLVAIERIKNGQLLKDEALENQFPSNSELAKFIKVLENHFEIQLPVSEIMFINSHLNMNKLAASELIYESPNDNFVREIIKDTIVNYDEASLVGLVTHIKSVIERIRKDLPIANPFIADVKQSFPISFEEAIQLKQKLEKTFELIIPEDETAYLAVHIQAFKERKKEENIDKIKVLLVCSSGKGTSQLLAARIRRKFPKLEISRILSIQELARTKITEDLILSTVNLEIENHTILYVSPVLSQIDQNKINKFIDEKKEVAKDTKTFARLIHQDLVFLDQPLANFEAVIHFIGKQLVRKGYVKKGIIQSAIDRESLSFTSFGKFATPHGAPELVLKSAIAFLRLKKEIKWGDAKVKYIFFICIKDESSHDLEAIYDHLLEIIDSGDKSFLAKGNQEQLLSYLKEGK